MHKNTFLILLPTVLFFGLFPFFAKAIDAGCSSQTPTCLGVTLIDVLRCKEQDNGKCAGGTEVYYQTEVRCGSNCKFNRCSTNDNIICTTYGATTTGFACLESNCNTAGNCCGGSNGNGDGNGDGNNPVTPPPTPTPPTPTPTVSCSRCSTVNGCQMASWANWGSSCDPYNPASSPTYITDCSCGSVPGGNNSVCPVPCSRCSTIYGCQKASWSNCGGVCDPYNPVGSPSYVVDLSCPPVAGGDNSACPLTPPPPSPTIPPCVPNGGACVADSDCCSGKCTMGGVCGGNPTPSIAPSIAPSVAPPSGSPVIPPPPLPRPVIITQFKITNFAERLDPDYNVFYIILADQMRVGFRANIRWAVAYGSSCQADCTYFDRDNQAIPVDCEWYGSVDPHYGNFKVGPTTPGVVAYTLTCLGEGNSQDSRSFSAGIKELTWQEVHPRNIVSLVLNPFVKWRIFQR